MALKLLATALAAPASTAAPSDLCLFSATLNQQCSNGALQPSTTLTIPSINDSTGKSLIQPNRGEAFPINQVPFVIGVPNPDPSQGYGKLYVTWDNEHGKGDHKGQPKWNFEGCAWWSDDGGAGPCGGCRWTAWSGAKPDCGEGQNQGRTSDLVCSFHCGATSDSINVSVDVNNSDTAQD